MAISQKIVVHLDPDQRRTLQSLIHNCYHSAAMIRRAQILLNADADGPDVWTDERIAEAYDTTRMTARRVRQQQFASEGLDATLCRKRPTGRQYRKLDGKQEAQLIAVACSPAPEGSFPLDDVAAG